jgi:hypothetical protein
MYVLDAVITWRDHLGSPPSKGTKLMPGGKRLRCAAAFRVYSQS